MSEPTAKQLAAVFLKIKAKREELSKVFKAQDGELEEQQKLIKETLLTMCREQDTDGFQTEAGRVTRSKKTKYWTSDWDEFGKFLIKHNAPELLNKQINQSNMKTFLEENPDDLPPGLNIDTEYVISIYKPRKKTGD
jgi:hypothetical protein